MAISRLYLGRHFLADVFGGIAVGMVAMFAARLLLRRLSAVESSGVAVRDLLPLGCLCFGLVALVPLSSLIDAENVGRLLGLLVAYGFVVRTGVPADGATPACRLARVTTAVILYLATSSLLEAILETAGWEEARVAISLSTALVIALSLAGTVNISRRARWYVSADGVTART
jgi:hypothetical protein